VNRIYLKQLKGEKFDGRADVYSMGVIFIELLYPMSTANEKMLVVETLRGKAKTENVPLKAFQKEHPVEVSPDSI